MNLLHSYSTQHAQPLDFQFSLSASLCQIFNLTHLEWALDDLKEHAEKSFSSCKSTERLRKITATANAILVDVYEMVLNAGEMSVGNFSQIEIQSRIAHVLALDQKIQTLLDETLCIVVQKIKALPSISEKFLFLDFFAGEKFSYNKLFKVAALPHIIELAALVIPIGKPIE